MGNRQTIIITKSRYYSRFLRWVLWKKESRVMEIKGRGSVIIWTRPAGFIKKVTFEKSWRRWGSVRKTGACRRASTAEGRGGEEGEGQRKAREGPSHASKECSLWWFNLVLMAAGLCWYLWALLEVTVVYHCIIISLNHKITPKREMARIEAPNKMRPWIISFVLYGFEGPIIQSQWQVAVVLEFLIRPQMPLDV